MAEQETENELLQDLLNLKDRAANEGFVYTYQTLAQVEQVLLTEIAEQVTTTSDCNCDRLFD